MTPLTLRISISAMVVLVSSISGWAEETCWPAAFYRAHYLASVEQDVDGALKLYEQVAAEGSLSESQQAALRDRIDDLREAQLAEHPARLFPADTMAYVELSRPGELAERLTTMLGIETAPVLAELAGRKPRGPINWDDPNPMSFLPERLVMSPALARWLSSFRGAAFGLTKLDEHEGDVRPQGVAVLNTGGTELMRGFIEMAAQFGPLCESIEGYPTYQFPEGVVATLTHRMVVVGLPRSSVEATVKRLRKGGEAGGGLADDEAFKKVCANRAPSTLFAYVNAQRAIAALSPQLDNDEDFQIARSVLDLDHLIGASLRLGAIDGGLGLDFSVHLAEGHHNLAYNLVRTPRMSRRSLACVPSNAAAVIGLAINPPSGESGPGSDSKARKLSSVTGLDLLRELFGNIEEFSLYIAPTQGGLLGGNSEDGAPAYIPNAALVIAASDAAKSEALWKTILAIPAQVMPKEAPHPESVTIAGREVTRLKVPEVGAIYVGTTDHCVVVSARREAIAAAFKASGSKRSILDDETSAAALKRLGDDVGSLFMLHGGRLLRTAAGLAPAIAGDDAPPPAVMSMMAGTLAKAFDSTVIYGGVTQSETEFNLQACIGGLPNVNMLLAQVGPIMQTFGAMHSSDRRPPSRVAGRQARQGDDEDQADEESSRESRRHQRTERKVERSEEDKSSDEGSSGDSEDRPQRRERRQRSRQPM